jgi:hypothetical protein
MPAVGPLLKPAVGPLLKPAVGPLFDRITEEVQRLRHKANRDAKRSNGLMISRIVVIG